MGCCCVCGAQVNLYRVGGEGRRKGGKDDEEEEQMGNGKRPVRREEQDEEEEDEEAVGLDELLDDLELDDGQAGPDHEAEAQIILQAAQQQQASPFAGAAFNFQAPSSLTGAGPSHGQR